jgi:serine protease Do
MVPVKILREGQEITVDITLGRLEVGEQIVAAQQPQAAPQPEDTDEPVGPPPGLKDMLGVDIGPLDEAARKTYAIGETVKGVLITEVAKGSDAERQGLLVGLVVSEVNQQKVTTVAEVTDKVGAAKEAGRPAVLFKVTDPTGASRFVAVKLN